MNLLIILWLLMVVASQAIRDQQAVTGESAFDRRKRKKRQIEEGLRPQPSTSSPEIPAVPDVDIEMPAINPIPSPPCQLLPAPPQPKFTAVGRPVRAKRKTWKLLQQPPAPAPPVVSDPSPDPEPSPVPQPATATWVWNTIRTTINGFGLYCEYPSVPSYNSD
ncbi:hypothetical protein B0H14DRAFT_2596188 [Mycena olivaceomarginata]|nr:hypothetical protein B0H14DRAFT_2596188 [Mycena olivaceomarginata]